MVALSLKIGVGNVVKTMQFEPSTMVYDACRMIRERVPEAQLGQREFSLSPTHFHGLMVFTVLCAHIICTRLVFICTGFETKRRRSWILIFSM